MLSFDTSLHSDRVDARCIGVDGGCGCGTVGPLPEALSLDDLHLLEALKVNEKYGLGRMEERHVNRKVSGGVKRILPIHTPRIVATEHASTAFWNLHCNGNSNGNRDYVP